MKWLPLLGGQTTVSQRVAITQLSVLNCRLESNIGA